MRGRIKGIHSTCYQIILSLLERCPLRGEPLYCKFINVHWDQCLCFWDNHRGSTYHHTGPDHQIYLSQNHQSPKKKKKRIVLSPTYYESVDSSFHAALWSCREPFRCQIYSQLPITHFPQGPITVHGKCALPLTMFVGINICGWLMP